MSEVNWFYPIQVMECLYKKNDKKYAVGQQKKVGKMLVVLVCHSTEALEGHFNLLIITYYLLLITYYLLLITYYLLLITYHITGPRSAVSNVSGNRCESDCRSRGRKFDPGPVPYFRGG